MKRINKLPFTEAQMKQIYNTNIIDFAVAHGFQIEKGDRSTVHVKNSGGLYLFKHGRGYYCFSTETKGNIVDFAMDYLGLSKREAMETILGCKAYESSVHEVEPAEKAAKGKLILPPHDTDNRRVFAYLTQARCIDPEIVREMMRQNKIYQSRQEVNGKVRINCAFVGYDESGNPGYCALRGPSPGSPYRQDVENSDKTCGFIMEGHSNRVYEFEAPIDAMSHATICKAQGMDWKADHRVSEGCLSGRALQKYLMTHPEIKEIVFCYDNDRDGRLPDGTLHNHGQEKAKQEAERFACEGYRVYIQIPERKDFNEWLVDICRGTWNRCQTGEEIQWEQ